MKKIIICVALLGAVSIGSMAFINNSHDDPPAQQTETTGGQNDRYDSREDGHRHGRHGGCCGRYNNNEDCKRYECCDYRQQCDACRDNCCTLENCHEDGNICQECAECHNNHRHNRAHRHCR